MSTVDVILIEGSDVKLTRGSRSACGWPHQWDFSRFRFAAMQAIDEPLAATETITVSDPAPLQSVAKVGPAGAKVKKKTKAPSSKVKKPSSRPRKLYPHPPYAEMIKEAISTLKERTGSSPYAIARFMEDKHKAHLPFNFRKILLLQLKKLVASGKFNKVKGSYKLSSGVSASGDVAAKSISKKPATSKPKDTVKSKPKSAVAKAKPVAPSSKHQATTVAKTKSMSSSSTKLKSAAAKPALKGKTPAKPKPKSAARPAKAAKASAKDAPGKKAIRAPTKSAAVPLKTAVKKPKSVTTPAKKSKK